MDLRGMPVRTTNAIVMTTDSLLFCRPGLPVFVIGVAVKGSMIQKNAVKVAANLPHRTAKAPLLTGPSDLASCMTVIGIRGKDMKGIAMDLLLLLDWKDW